MQFLGHASQVPSKRKLIFGYVSRRVRTAQWKVDDDGFSAMEGSLAKTYRRGRKALRKAHENGGTESFHEWRKRVHYHWYHARLLRRIRPDMLKMWRKATDELSDLPTSCLICWAPTMT